MLEVIFVSSVKEQAYAAHYEAKQSGKYTVVQDVAAASFADVQRMFLANRLGELNDVLLRLEQQQLTQAGA